MSILLELNLIQPTLHVDCLDFFCSYNTTLKNFKKLTMQDYFELNDLLVEIFPELESYINQIDDDLEYIETNDELMASRYEVTVDYYRMEFKV